MAREERRSIIEQIEAARGSRVLTYITGDRAPAPGQIGDDAVRPMYDHLREMGHVEKLDLVIYSRGERTGSCGDRPVRSPYARPVEWKSPLRGRMQRVGQTFDDVQFYGLHP